jgi:hypothetical protein
MKASSCDRMRAAVSLFSALASAGVIPSQLPLLVCSACSQTQRSSFDSARRVSVLVPLCT